MRRGFLSGVIAAVAIVALAGCTTDSGVAKESSAEPVVVRISGSGTCTPLVRLLTDTYDGVGVDWRYLPGLHSSGGVNGVARGELELGAVSRELTPEEKALGLVYTPLSADGVVIAVHPSVGLTGLSAQQVRDIYAGMYRNWSELGGSDLPIIVLDRNEDESAKMIMRQHVFGQDLVIAAHAAQLYYEMDMVEGLQSTVGAIGYFSLGYGVSRDVSVTFLALDGVQPTVENIENGTYVVVRPLGLVSSPDAAPEIKDFLEWATSDTAVALIESNGFAAAR